MHLKIPFIFITSSPFYRGIGNTGYGESIVCEVKFLPKLYGMKALWQHHLVKNKEFLSLKGKFLC